LKQPITEPPKKRAPHNRTLTLTETDYARLQPRLLKLNRQTPSPELDNRTVCQDIFEALNYLPDRFVDLAFIDPPYNLNKTFNQASFQYMDAAAYADWLDSWLKRIVRLLKPTASIYICGDWRSSTPIFNVMSRYFYIRNRITWEREKGRGANANWKNCTEDIWFATVSNDYTFNLDAVKMKRKVIAPYRDTARRPKDWEEAQDGSYRITHPSNIWTDISIPFWSMPENTDHPTQKPEKLLAKIILASSNPQDMVFDPFCGSGTASVTAKKLNRRYLGVEMDNMYCCLTEKRLELAENDKTIQGYSDGVFWERNTLSEQQRKTTPVKPESK